MGIGFIILTFLGLLLLVLSPVVYFIFKRLHLKKTGIVISIVLAFAIIISSLSMVFESQLYFKSDAVKDLKINGITLFDDFEIIENEISGTIDYYQFTTLAISKKDKQRILKTIKNSTNFTTVNEEYYLLNTMRGLNSEYVVANYSFYDNYYRASYKKMEGYSPVFIAIIVNPNSNLLKISRIED